MGIAITTQRIFSIVDCYFYGVDVSALACKYINIQSKKPRLILYSTHTMYEICYRMRDDVVVLFFCKFNLDNFRGVGFVSEVFALRMLFL